MKKTEGKILIVDDNLMNIELLEATLEPLGVEILTFSSPLEALRETKNKKIDVALIDVVMPEIDGFQFTEEFVKEHKETPVIYVSAHGENENKIRGYKLGSLAYIEKPFDVNTTRAQVQSVLKLKHMQDELFKEKEKLDMIYEFTNNEIIITDLNFEIVSQNNKLLEKTVYSNKSFIQILKENEQTEGLNLLEKFTVSEEKQTTFRFIFLNGKFTRTTVSKITVDGEQVGYLIMMIDITEEIEAQKQKERFIEMLTHDLKTPVRAEKRALELLLSESFGKINKEQEEIIKEILNSSRYMMRMTDNVLTRYKINNGQCKIAKKPNSIRQTLQSSVDGLKYLLENENQKVIITTNLENDIFDFDELEIKRVLTNLITNASEYSPKGTSIYISVAQKDDNLEITVEDEGHGIADDKLEYIFEEYITGSEKFKKVGTGLGLFITKKIVEAHKGKVHAESKKEGGSKFIFSLPVEKTADIEITQY